MARTSKKLTSTKKKTETAVASLTLNGILFKDMVARSRKAASNSIMSPLSQMMAIELKDNKLTLITTDATNYLYIMQDKVEGDDFYVTVMADTFAQLIAKTTSDKITLELMDNALKVIGNGEYIVELPEEEGEIIKFPDPRNEVELEPLDDIQLSTVQAIVDSAKASLAVTLEEPCFVNYYCGERIIATDNSKICFVDLSLWEAPRLIPGEVFDLVTLMTEENIKVSAADDIIMFSTPDCVVYARTADGLEDYPAEDINELLENEFPSSCKVKKSDMLQLLDRLSLFVAKNDKSIIYLTFTKEGLQVTSKKSNGVETVPYIESNDFVDFRCAIDIGMLQSQLKSFSDDAVTVEYGNNAEDEEGNAVATAIKFIDGNAIMFIALIDDSQEE